MSSTCSPTRQQFRTPTWSRPRLLVAEPGRSPHTEAPLRHSPAGRVRRAQDRPCVAWGQSPFATSYDASRPKPDWFRGANAINRLGRHSPAASEVKCSWARLDRLSGERWSTGGLGRSRLEVARLGLGTVLFGMPLDELTAANLRFTSGEVAELCVASAPDPPPRQLSVTRWVGARALGGGGANGDPEPPHPV